MKRAAILSLFLLLGSAAFLSAGSANTRQSDSDFRSFWTKFKTAVTSGNKETVGQLSKFPLGVSSPALDIKNRSELRQRFREIFVDQVNASECFAHTEPAQDTENAQMFTVACRYNNGSDAAVYQFDRAAAGWKFTHFQLSTTCRCR
jgi:hypothetical protein